ncbi:aldo/keto reductase [Candidatus Korarchaeum cryptofilum]|uniref:Aldo/keto reductase n=1 Tax=Candidatus Korarchaeum cryptofilum TaxID=498846 RepID=A0A429GAW6_9CREN|nr:aldo/keto reductase [Candidatus Korarchaeum cryptofilum]RSN70950.1 aldo/keto reductase [Candidatus Korarchaeum cryptofilum]
MKYERLGRTNIKVSKIGLGTWQFGSSYWGWGKELDRDEVVLATKVFPYRNSARKPTV